MNRSRDRHSHRKGNNWKNNSRQENSQNSEKAYSFQSKKQFRPPKVVTLEQIKEDEEAIRVFKSKNRPVCSHCGQPIVDMSSAFANREGKELHFDCVLEILSESEKIAEDEKISYIGQGRFGVVKFQNPNDVKHFTIKKIIEWEEKDSRLPWRNTMAELYSHIK